jgi:hypothetical protein
LQVSGLARSGEPGDELAQHGRGGVWLPDEPNKSVLDRLDAAQVVAGQLDGGFLERAELRRRVDVGEPAAAMEEQATGRQRDSVGRVSRGGLEMLIGRGVGAEQLLERLLPNRGIGIAELSHKVLRLNPLGRGGEACNEPQAPAGESAWEVHRVEFTASRRLQQVDERLLRLAG